MIKLKNILREEIDIIMLKKICNHWNSVPDSVKNAFVADERNYLSTGMPIDMQQICKDPQNWSFNDRDAEILKRIITLPNA